ncbi:MAG: glycosyltransferase, partial [Thermoanaerobaculia bacterium]
MSEQDIPTELPEPLPDARSEGALRIAFLTTEYATEPTFYDGGVAQLLGRQSRALLERGHRVEVFVIGDDEVTYEADGVIVHRVRATSRAADFLHTQANRVFRHGWHESVHCLSVAASLRGALLRRHREAPFDLAQVTSLRAAPLLLGRGLSALPVVVQLSSDFEAVRKAYRQKPTADGRLARWLTLQACRRARNIYVPSDLVARAMAERHGMRVRVLRPTVELKKVPCDWSIYEEHGKGRDYLLFHGSIGRLKGVA